MIKLNSKKLQTAAKAAMFVVGLIFSNQAFARDNIKIVGSSTVYPFTTVIAEEFSLRTKSRTPIVESTGTGGGIKLFCGGAGERHPDFVNASRQIKKSEVDECNKNGVKSIVEIKIGYDGIVVANSKNAPAINLSEEQIFLALAKEIPQNGKLVANPYKKWSDIDKSLPNKEITVYGPPPTSGTRDSFVELVMEKVCVENKDFIAAYPDQKVRTKNCHVLRTDGKYIEAGENDNLIIQKLRSNSDAFGIFGFSFLEQNTSTIQGAKIHGVTPNFDTIANGSYPISRPLFLYTKKEHFDIAPNIREFIKEAVSTNAIGQNGYLTEKGLIPMPQNEYKKISAEILQSLK